MKQCNKCNKIKALAEFPKRKDSPDGFRNTCKDCRNKYLIEYRLNPPVKEVVSEGLKICYKCKEIKSTDNFGKNTNNKDGLKSYCKECVRLESVSYRKKNVDKIKEYRENNKEKISESNENYRLNNKERIFSQRKEYRENNKEKISKYKHNWYEKNKDKTLEGKRRRRARKLGCDENYTKEDRKTTLLAFGYKCFNCGNTDNLCVDHHRPLIKGNPLSLENAVVLCKTCNASKGSKDPEIFYGIKRCAELDKKLAQIKGE